MSPLTLLASGADPSAVQTGVTWMAIAAWVLLGIAVVWHGMHRRGAPEHRLSGKDMRKVVLEAHELDWGGTPYVVWDAVATDHRRRELARVTSRATVQAAFNEVLAMAAALDDTTPIDIPPPRPNEPPVLASLRRTQDDDDDDGHSGMDSPVASGSTRPRQG